MKFNVLEQSAIDAFTKRFDKRIKNTAMRLDLIRESLVDLDSCEITTLDLCGWKHQKPLGWTHPQLNPKSYLSRARALQVTRAALLATQLL